MDGKFKPQPRSFLLPARRWVLGLTAGVVLGCQGTPPTPVRVQGTVTSVGYGLAVKNARVEIKWPAPLGGGSTLLQTNAKGQYAIERSVRGEVPNCAGIVLTVQAPGYASIYSNRSDTNCGNGLLTINFKLFPLS